MSDGQRATLGAQFEAARSFSMTLSDRVPLRSLPALAALLPRGADAHGAEGHAADLRGGVGPAPLLPRLAGIDIGLEPVAVAPVGTGIGGTGIAGTGIGLDEALPDGGLPRGAVVEIAAPRGLARATSFALATCAAAQAAAPFKGAFCAFVDPWATLHAPAVLRHGVDLERLLVVRPSLSALARVAVRLAESRVFSVLAIDTVGLPGASSVGASSGGASSGGARAHGGEPSFVRLDRWPTVVRRLALAAQSSLSAGADTTVLLLTDLDAARPLPLPVALRIELTRTARAWRLRVAKERHGRVRSPVVLAGEGAAGDEGPLTGPSRRAASGS